MMISEIPTRFRAFQKDEQSESPPQTGWSEIGSECRRNTRDIVATPASTPAPRPCRPRLPRRAASEGPGPSVLVEWTFDDLIDDYNSISASVNQYFVDYGRSAHVDRSRSLR